jgi:hypothetical protein
MPAAHTGHIWCAPWAQGNGRDLRPTSTCAAQVGRTRGQGRINHTIKRVEPGQGQSNMVEINSGPFTDGSTSSVGVGVRLLEEPRKTGAMDSQHKPVRCR